LVQENIRHHVTALFLCITTVMSKRLPLGNSNREHIKNKSHHKYLISIFSFCLTVGVQKLFLFFLSHCLRRYCFYSNVIVVPKILQQLHVQHVNRVKTSNTFVRKIHQPCSKQHHLTSYKNTAHQHQRGEGMCFNAPS